MADALAGEEAYPAGLGGAVENNLLLKAETRIRATYAELGHDQGWSFLYTPGATLSSQARFLFMGLNPGGKGGSASASLTTEKGNAYHPDVENNWIGDGKAAPLQVQVVKFYEMLGERLEHDDPRKLMDLTLAANFCPFRSSSWNELHNQKATLEFCYELWASLFLELKLSTVVCMSLLVYEQMGAIAALAGGKEIDTKEKYIGWGKVKYRYKKFQYSDRDLLILCLPHMSRYKVFTSPNCVPELKIIVDEVATSLTGWIPK